MNRELLGVFGAKYERFMNRNGEGKHTSSMRAGVTLERYRTIRKVKLTTTAAFMV